jgi:heavy metal sensor kinase
MNLRSIGLRLTAWYGAILAATFLAFGIGTFLAIRSSIHRTVDRDLQSRLVRMGEFLANQEGGAAEFVEELGEHMALAPSGTQFQLCGPDRTWLYQSPEAKAWNLSPPRAGRYLQTENVVANGKSLRLLTATVPAGILQIGVPMDSFDAMLRTFALTLVAASPLVLLIASIGGYWMSRRALDPVDRIAERAQEIGALNLSGRLPLRGSGDELDRLSETLNAMLERIESAFKRVTQFTADASHELRTPAAIIHTTAEVALSRPRTPEEHERAWQLVISESERTAKLIGDLLTLARADSGSGGLVLEPMDLVECVQEACRDGRILAESANLLLEVDLPESCTCHGDRDALGRLCLILLDNAVKYTSSGGKVSVALRLLPDSCVLEVRDTGIGIPCAEQLHIFDRFYRVAGDRSRKTGGAGLGLAIAQWIVQRHRGTLTVESFPGKGSTFAATLPAVSPNSSGGSADAKGAPRTYS